jgi:hypothetical protein
MTTGEKRKVSKVCRFGIICFGGLLLMVQLPTGELVLSDAKAQLGQCSDVCDNQVSCLTPCRDEARHPSDLVH